jgi:hypothetical protein
MEALGRDFSGYISDQLTDLYRNPSYFSKVTKPFLLGEIYKAPNFKIGYNGKFGILVRGNFSNSKKDDGKTDDGLLNNIYSIEETKNYSTRNDRWFDTQILYGAQFSNKISYGFGYTFGYNQYPSNLLNVNKTETIESEQYSSYSYYRRTSSNNKTDQSTTDNTMNHILRTGVIWDLENYTLDGLLTLEYQTSENTRESYHNWHYKTIRNQSYLSGQNTFDMEMQDRLESDFKSYDLDVYNLKLDLLYKENTQTNAPFIAHAGIGFTHFESKDNISSGEQSTYLDESSGYTYNDTSLRYSLNQDDYYTLPNGYAFQIKGGIVWNFQHNDFLFALGPTIKFWYNSYKYNVHNTIVDSETISYSSPETTIVEKGTSESNIYRYTTNLSRLRVSIPLCVEYEAYTDLFFRSGWVVNYVFNDKNINGIEYYSQSTSEFSHSSSGGFDYSTVTFGFGYKPITNLEVDVITSDNIFSPRSWYFSVVYRY